MYHQIHLCTLELNEKLCAISLDLIYFFTKADIEAGKWIIIFGVDLLEEMLYFIWSWNSRI